MDHLLHTN